MSNTAETTEIKENQPARVLTPEEEKLFHEMINAGVLLGRRKSKTNPRMSKFIFNYTRGIAVFDLEQVSESINKAGKFLCEVYEKKLPILLVGTQLPAREIVENFSKKYNLPYVTERWLGGTLTNFNTINKRVEYFKKLKEEKASGQLEKYTKKERLLLDRLMERMSKFFSGLEIMNQLPAALLVIDANEHHTAVREAVKLNIPIVAMINSDNNPDNIAYPIPANDNARPSLEFIFGKIGEELDKAKKI